MSNVTRHTPYVAPGAPSSPIIMAVAGLLVAVASTVAARLGFKLPADSMTVASVAAALVGLVGFLQSRLAQREQLVGARLLRATVAAPPVDPEQVGEALGRLRALALQRPRRAPKRRLPVKGFRIEGAPRQTTIPTGPTAAEQLRLLDRWSGKALRRILAGERWGTEGPISWEATGRHLLAVEIDGIARDADLDDIGSVAAACGADAWLEVDSGFMRDSGGRWMAVDQPAPRPRIPSGALLDSGGDPLTPGDLDSGELEAEDADPDERRYAEGL